MQMSRPRANATEVRAENKQSVWVGLAGELSCKETCSEEYETRERERERDGSMRKRNKR